MIKIFATEKIKEIDRYTIQRKSMSSIDLVEEAVTVFTNEFRNNYPKTRRVIVFAGRGNNGADALGIARNYWMNPIVFWYIYLTRQVI